MIDDKHDKIESKANARIRRHTLGLVGFLVLVCLVASLSSLSAQPSTSTAARESPHAREKLLYIVTTLSEYDSGHRDTIRGFDRLRETLIPVVRESIESMIMSGFDVDLVIICHYNMTRRNLIREALPATVGLQVWDNASPLGYKLEGGIFEVALPWHHAGTDPRSHSVFFFSFHQM